VRVHRHTRATNSSAYRQKFRALNLDTHTPLNTGHAIITSDWTE
jgi:hypothetical protein